MSKIQLLDQITIDKIAAGEVIERPVSVVKELVENAIDAGANNITVEIEQGGITFIRITDNGKGIFSDDVPKAFLRHSTSKIRQVEDLYTINTLGFRGEALASVAAVSKMELITKTEEETTGIKYQIEGGVEISLTEVGAPVGSTFIIRQLFYNVPARKKFLKTPSTEASHIGELLMRLALSHPKISFKFISNQQEKLRTYGNGKLSDVIYALYGKKISGNLLPIDYKKGVLKITGFIGKPEINRGNRNYETFFVNGRYIKSSMISKSIEDAYKSYVMQHKFPFVVLHFTIDGSQVDVNVHPTKMELRFQNQNEIFQSIYECVHQALLEPELIPKITLENTDVSTSPTNMPKDNPERKVSPFSLRQAVHEEKPFYGNELNLNKNGRLNKDNILNAIETFGQDEAKSWDKAPSQNTDLSPDKAPSQNTDLSPDKAPSQDTDLSRNKASSQDTDLSRNKASSQDEDLSPKETYFLQKMRERVHQYHTGDAKSSSSDEKDTTFDKKNTTSEKKGATTNEQLTLFESQLLKGNISPSYQLIGQVFNTYWLVTFGENLYIIDQHAAHEKVLYERVLSELKTREYTSQQISPPLVLNLSMLESSLLTEHMGSFTKIGFEIEHFGGDSYTVRAVPANLFSIAERELFVELLDSLSTEISSKMTPDKIDNKIATLACKGAVKGRQQLSAEEADQLIGDLLTLENPYFCPHGRPTIIAFTKKELEKKFKRIV